MRHLLRRALPLLAVGMLLSVVAPTPAQAHTDVCSGTFVMSTASGLGAPLVTGVTTNYSLSMTTGACASGTSFQAAGTLTGACVVATGNGITNTGHSYVFQLTTVMTFTGGVTGTLTVVSDPFANGSCLNGGATGFILTGALILN